MHAFVLLLYFCDRKGHLILWDLPFFDKDRFNTQVLTRSLKPTETRIISLSSLRPIELIGGSCNQFPECGDAADNYLALLLISDALHPAWILEASSRGEITRIFIKLVQNEEKKLWYTSEYIFYYFNMTYKFNLLLSINFLICFNNIVILTWIHVVQ